MEILNARIDALEKKVHELEKVNSDLLAGTHKSTHYVIVQESVCGFYGNEIILKMFLSSSKDGFTNVLEEAKNFKTKKQADNYIEKTGFADSSRVRYKTLKVFSKVNVSVYTE